MSLTSAFFKSDSISGPAQLMKSRSDFGIPQ
jgi:hypothetical protein